MCMCVCVAVQDKNLVNTDLLRLEFQNNQENLLIYNVSLAERFWL